MAEDQSVAAAEVRGAIREAHEVIKDLNAAIKRAEKVAEQIAEVAAMSVSDRLDEAVAVGLASYRAAIDTAIENATEAVFKRFDTLGELLLSKPLMVAIEANNQQQAETAVQQLVARRLDAEHAARTQGGKR